jgi:hypothetical protein
MTESERFEILARANVDEKTAMWVLITGQAVSLPQISGLIWT